MARLRTLKPGFFKNELLCELPPETRLCFAGLWCWADCRGVLEYRPKRLKIEIFPYDNFKIERMIIELKDAGFITLYEIDGEALILINNWEKHQKPHYKEQENGKLLPDNTLQNTQNISDEDVIDPKYSVTSPVVLGLRSLVNGLRSLGEDEPAGKQPDHSKEIWNYYVEVFSKRKDMSRGTFRDDLKKAVNARLAKYSVENIKMAIDRMFEDLDVWEGRISNCDLKFVVRSAKQLEYWFAWEKPVAKGEKGVSRPSTPEEINEARIAGDEQREIYE